MDVSQVISDILSANRGLDPLDPDRRVPAGYEVQAALDRNILSMTLTFKSEFVYCCFEWGCHLTFPDGERWKELRQKLAANDITTPTRLRLRLSCVIESGARCFDISRPDPKRRGWYEFMQAKSYNYHVESTETCFND